MDYVYSFLAFCLVLASNFGSSFEVTLGSSWQIWQPGY